MKTDGIYDEYDKEHTLEERIKFYLDYYNRIKNTDRPYNDVTLEIIKELRQELRSIKLKKITKTNEKEI